MKKYFYLFSFQLLLLFAPAQSLFSQGQAQAAYQVGFEYQVVTDYARSFGNTARPVQLYIWYPSKEKPSSPMPYLEYIRLDQSWASTQDQVSNDTLIERYIQKLLHKAGPVNDGMRTRLAAMKTNANRGAGKAEGSFPLLLLAPGGTTPGYIHATLAEYLASRGYIVVGMSALGMVPGERWPFNARGLDLQMNDMELAINYCFQTFSQVKSSSVGLLSWSVGGVSQAILAAKSPQIGALVSLDAGLVYAYGKEMFRSSIYGDFKSITIPYLEMTGEQAGQFVVEKSKVFYDSIATDLKYHYSFRQMAHHHFNAELGVVSGLILDQTVSEVNDSYEIISKMTGDFLDEFLKNIPGSYTESPMTAGHSLFTQEE